MHDLMCGLVNRVRRICVRRILPRGAVAVLLPIAILAGPAAGEPLDPSVIKVKNARGFSAPLDKLLPDGPVILHFWATWCAPCREELPDLAAFKADLAKSGLETRLVLISVDSLPYAQMAAFLTDDLGLSGLDSLQADARMTGAVFRLAGYPSTVWLGREREEAGRHTSAMAWSAPSVRAGLVGHLTQKP